MKYKTAGLYACLSAEVLKKNIGEKTPEEIAEFIRWNFVIAMRSGKGLCIDIDRTAPDFNEFVTEGTYTNNFFDWEWMNNYDNYI